MNFFERQAAAPRTSSRLDVLFALPVAGIEFAIDAEAFLANGAGADAEPGEIGALLDFTTLLTLGVWERRWTWMRPLIWWPGPLLAGLIVAPWFIAISVETSGRFFFDMMFGDIGPKLVSGDDGHFALPGYHLFLLPFLIFPATYALPAAARLAWETMRAPRVDSASVRATLTHAVAR